MPCWAAVAICVVDFDEQHGQIIRHLVPSGFLSETALHDVKMMAMPDCLQSGTNHDLQYQFRIREKSIKDYSNQCLNCYVSFRQSRDSLSQRGFSQKSVVLVCNHPFSELSVQTLSVLVAVIDSLPEQEHQSVQISPSFTSHLLSTLEVAMVHMEAWPPAMPDQSIVLPFFGEMLSLSVPTLSTYVSMGVETGPILCSTSTPSFNNDDSSRERYMRAKKLGSCETRSIYSNTTSGTYGLGGGSGMFSELNIVSLLRPLGLLPHLWTLWELVVTGKSILVWSPSPDVCSRVVTALVSLCAPLVYGGDFRPYINPYDSDVEVIREALSKRASSEAVKMEGNCDDNGRSSSRSGVPWEYRLQSPSQKKSGPGGSGVGRCIGDSGSTGTKPPPSIIVGVTNPHLLRSFSLVDAAIFLPLPRNTPSSPRSKRKGRGGGKMHPSMFSSRVSSREVREVSPPRGTSTPIHPTDATPVSSSGCDVSPSTEQPARIPMKVKPPHPVSFLDIAPSRTSSPLPPFSPASLHHGCTVNRIDATFPLETTYERWSGGGGFQSSTLLTLRSGVCVKPDQSMMHRLLDSHIEEPMSFSPSRGLSHSPTSASVTAARGLNEYGFLGSLLGDLGEVLSGSGGRGGDDGGSRLLPQGEEEVRDVMGNMMIREHFRQLTYSLMKPFEGHFRGSSFSPPTSSPLLLGSTSSSSSVNGRGGDDQQSTIVKGTHRIVSQSTPLSSSMWEGVSLLAPFSSDNSTVTKVPSPPPPPVQSRSPPMPPTNTLQQRQNVVDNGADCDSSSIIENYDHVSMQSGIRRASSPWLYRNPSEFLDGSDITDCIDQYLSGSNDVGVDNSELKNIPEAFLGNKRRELFTSFGTSDTFRQYFSWRRGSLRTGLLLDLSQACSSLSARELVEQLAIEQGVDVPTTAQMRELARRIGWYILALSSEHNTHCGHYEISTATSCPVPVTVDTAIASTSQCSNDDLLTGCPHENDESGATTDKSAKAQVLSFSALRTLSPQPQPLSVSRYSSVCACCQYIQQRSGCQNNAFSTEEIINNMQDHLNYVVALTHTG